MELTTTTWTRLDRPGADRPLLAVPLGSCEQHGPHLPLGTDTIIATHLARGLAARRTDTVVGPPITVSASGEHAGFPGTLSIGSRATATVLVELVRSAVWASGIVIVNGHGGNATALRDAAEIWRAEGRDVLVWSPAVAGGDLHAGHTETSLMLAIDPDLVDRAAAVPGPTPAVADLVRHGVRALSPSGVLGDPTTAAADTGAELLDGLVDDLVGAVAERWPT